MKKIIKQVVGTDVAKKELVVSLGRMYDDWTPELYGYKTFDNNRKGFEALIKWVRKNTDQAVEVRFVMEATGIYHESFAYFLDESGYNTSIVLPNKISNYIRTLEVKTITDSTAADAIAMFGLERKLELWRRPKDLFKKLRQLTRERGQIIEERTSVKNQLHAEKAEAEPNKGSISRLQERIKLLNKQEKEIGQELATLIKNDEQSSQAVIILCSLPGIGLLTAAIVLAETNGFELIRNRRQLTSYTGLDVVEKKSGISVRGKSKISKRGNKYLRKAMHYPALAAIRSDERFKAIYARTIARHGIKMKAIVPVQRKLLEMTYTLFKGQKMYDKAYLNTNEVTENLLTTKPAMS